MINAADTGLVAVMGLTTVEIVKLWQSVAPSLEEVRAAPMDDIATATRLQDANILGAGVAVMVGGTTSLLLKSWLPLLMALGSVTLFSYWHRMVYLSDHSVMEANNGPAAVVDIYAR